MSAGDTIRMTSGAPWSVKGIDPKAREIAKDLARRSGMTLGEWLNRMIVEGDAVNPADIVARNSASTRSRRSRRRMEPVVVRLAAARRRARATRSPATRPTRSAGSQRPSNG
jgi:localization factor PodJL